MKPNWFHDTIPLDRWIAPMVLFFQNNGITTLQSCDGSSRYHLYGRPTITFQATKLKEIDKVAKLLKDNELDMSLEIGLMTGFFAPKIGIGIKGKRYGQAQWIWTKEGKLNHYKEFVYNRVIKLVSMKEIQNITMDLDEWKQQGYKKIG
jgi:hypothetical protein